MKIGCHFVWFSFFFLGGGSLFFRVTKRKKKNTGRFGLRFAYCRHANHNKKTEQKERKEVKKRRRRRRRRRRKKKRVLRRRRPKKAAAVNLADASHDFLFFSSFGVGGASHFFIFVSLSLSLVVLVSFSLSMDIEGYFSGPLAGANGLAGLRSMGSRRTLSGGCISAILLRFGPVSAPFRFAFDVRLRRPGPASLSPQTRFAWVAFGFVCLLLLLFFLEGQAELDLAEISLA